MKIQIKSQQEIYYQDVILTKTNGDLAIEFIPKSDADHDLHRVRVLLDTASAEHLIALLSEHLAESTTEPPPSQKAETRPINWEEYEGRILPDQLENLKQFVGGSKPASGFTIERLLADEIYYPEDITWLL